MWFLWSSLLKVWQFRTYCIKLGRCLAHLFDISNDHLDYVHVQHLYPKHVLLFLETLSFSSLLSTCFSGFLAEIRSQFPAGHQPVPWWDLRRRTISWVSGWLWGNSSPSSDMNHEILLGWFCWSGILILWRIMILVYVGSKINQTNQGFWNRNYPYCRWLASQLCFFSQVSEANPSR